MIYIQSATEVGIAVAILSLVLPGVLAYWAQRKGRSAVAWAIIGVLPLINIIGALVLAAGRNDHRVAGHRR